MIAAGILPQAEVRTLTFSLPAWYGSERHPKQLRLEKLVEVLGFTTTSPADLVWQLLGGDTENNGIQHLFTPQQLELLTNPTRLHRACQTSTPPALAVETVELDGVVIPHGDFDSPWRASLVALALLTEHIPNSGFGQLVDFLYTHETKRTSRKKTPPPLDWAAEYFTEKIGFLKDQQEQKNRRKEAGTLKEITTLEEWVASFGHMTTIAAHHLEQQPDNKQSRKQVYDTLNIPKQFLNNKRYQISVPQEHIVALNQKLSIQLQHDLRQARSQTPFTSLKQSVLVHVLAQIHQGEFTQAVVESFYTSLPKMAQQPLESLSHEQIVLILSSEMEIMSRPQSDQKRAATDSITLALAQQLHTTYGFYYINGTFGSEHTALALHGVFGLHGAFDMCMIHTPIQFDLMSNALANLQSIPLLAPPLIAPALAAPGWSLASLASPLGLLSSGLLAGSRFAKPAAGKATTSKTTVNKKETVNIQKTVFSQPPRRVTSFAYSSPAKTKVKVELTPRERPTATKEKAPPKKSAQPKLAASPSSLREHTLLPKPALESKPKPRRVRVAKKKPPISRVIVFEKKSTPWPQPNQKLFVEAKKQPPSHKNPDKRQTTSALKEKKPTPPTLPIKPKLTLPRVVLRQPDNPTPPSPQPRRHLSLPIAALEHKRATRRVAQQAARSAQQKSEVRSVVQSKLNSELKTVRSKQKTINPEVAVQRNEKVATEQTSEQTKTVKAKETALKTTIKAPEHTNTTPASTSETPAMQVAQLVIGGAINWLSKEMQPAETVANASPETRRRRGVTTTSTRQKQSTPHLLMPNQPLHLAISSPPRLKKTKRRSRRIDRTQSVATDDSFTTARTISNWLKEYSPRRTHRQKRQLTHYDQLTA
jgi:hypothetical protein